MHVFYHNVRYATLRLSILQNVFANVLCILSLIILTLVMFVQYLSKVYNSLYISR